MSLLRDYLLCLLLVLSLGTKLKSQDIDLAGTASKNGEINIKSYIVDDQYMIDVQRYKLNFDFDVKNKILTGKVWIVLTVKDKGLKSINLNFYDNLKIEKLNLNDKKSEFLHKGTNLTIPFDNKKDTNIVYIEYKGTPKKEGLSAFVFGKWNNRDVVYNLSEPNYASTFFPCNDIPSDKAFVDVYMTNDSSFTSISNGILRGVETKNEKKTYHWETIYPISTYLVSVYSSKYINFHDTYVSQDKKDTMKIEYYAFPEHLEKAKRDFKKHPEMIETLSKIFGEYPFIKEKYGVAEFLWQLGAMENQTITGIGSTLVTGNEDFEDVLVHELAHSWWGNSVGPKTWKDIWLNEGFATYSEVLYYEALHGKESLIAEMEKLKGDYEGRLYDPECDLFDIMVYNKGAWVLHMLRSEVGDETFFKIVKEYYGRYKYSNASTEDFINVCQSVSGKDLSEFFDQWVYKGTSIVYADIMYRTISKENKTFLQIKLRQTKDIYKFNLKFRIDNGIQQEEKILKIDKAFEDFEFEVSNRDVLVQIDPNSEILGYFNIKDKTKVSFGK